MPGDEIIVPSMTFIASVAPILTIGASPCFVDIDPITYCLDVNQVKKKINPRTKAIMPVHIYGRIANMSEIVKIAQEENLFIIEDCSQAHGAEMVGKKVGSFGDIGCFSLYPSKNLSVCGQGGLIVTNNDEYYQFMKSIINYGQFTKDDHNQIGFNFAMSEIHAAIGVRNCEKLLENNQKRIKNAKIYYDLLNGVTSIDLPEILDNFLHVYHLFVIQCQNSIKRDNLKLELLKNGVQTGIHYQIPVHKQRLFHNTSHFHQDLPHTERLCSRVLSIPMSSELDENELNYIAEKIKIFIKNS